MRKGPSPSRLIGLLSGALIVCAFSSGCADSAAKRKANEAGTDRLSEAEAFVARASSQLDDLERRATLAGFTNGVDSTPEHRKALEQALLDQSRAKVALWKEAAKYDGLQLPPATARSIQLIRVPPSQPPPFEAKAAADLFSLQTVLTTNYTNAQDCVGRANCRPKAGCTRSSRSRAARQSSCPPGPSGMMPRQRFADHMRVPWSC